MAPANKESDHLTRRQRTRRRPRSGGGAPPRAKYPFPLNVILNVKVFYVFFIVLMIGGLAAGALASGGSSGSKRQPITPVANESVTPEPTRLAGVKTYPAEPALTIDPSKKYTAIIQTDFGEIQVQLLPDQAPRAVNSFVFLAKDGFYNGLSFFRVIPNFIVQAGDPTCDAAGQFPCTGAGGPGYILPLEGSNQARDAGVVAMAAIGGSTSNISGSQFYILEVPATAQDDLGSVFGKVTGGMNILASLPARDPCFGQPTRNATCQPNPPPGPRIISIRIQEG
ncbi:MAG TPA: peptidylprolyl isomerase [Dehalococcoidia bacterium]|nr:peptidylprolyl isomerase [Dehalococcoidia bacterium]